MQLVTTLGFRTLGLHKIWGVHYANNQRTGHIVDKLGFVPEGTLRHEYVHRDAFHDMHRHAMLEHEFEARSQAGGLPEPVRDDHASAPFRPLPFTALPQLPRVRQPVHRCVVHRHTMQTDSFGPVDVAWRTFGTGPEPLVRVLGLMTSGYSWRRARALGRPVPPGDPRPSRIKAPAARPIAHTTPTGSQTGSGSSWTT